MPINIANTLPAKKVLESENIFVMTEERAQKQDIRPLRIVIVNLMPTKIVTETQLLRLLSNTPLQVDIDLMQMATHQSKNTPQEHLLEFYQTFEDLKDNRYDGMIITGAPVETLAFEQVDYWQELQQVMDWSKTHVYSTMHICWGAQAGLYHHYGIDKFPRQSKLSGVYLHRPTDLHHPLLRGFDDQFYMPHSRYTEVRKEDILAHSDLELLVESDQAGATVIISKDGRRVFVTGHCEYDRLTLSEEYVRDIKRGLNPDIPEHYFPGDNPEAVPPMVWRSHAHLLFANWLNYFVYQSTPYDLSQLPQAT